MSRQTVRHTHRTMSIKSDSMMLQMNAEDTTTATCWLGGITMPSMARMVAYPMNSWKMAHGIRRMGDI